MPTFRYLTDRAGTVAGLRALADLIESDETFPLPAGVKPSFHLHGEDAKTRARDIMRKLAAGRWNKDEWENSLVLEGWLHGLPIDVWLDRDQVCERVVTGTREITETVPVGEDTRPVETLTRTEDVVEWVCSPILAEAGEIA